MQHALNRRSVLQLAGIFGVLQFWPAATIARQHSFNIFFDFESTAISSGGSQLADLIARQILPVARVSLIGYADTAETSPERISYARGNEVLKYFLRKPSMARVRFNVVTGGTSALLVNTGPNTKEPQNRRVEIRLDI